MRNPQDEANDAHDQGQQLFSLQEAQDARAKLVFYERYSDLDCGELRHTQNMYCVYDSNPICCVKSGSLVISYDFETFLHLCLGRNYEADGC